MVRLMHVGWRYHFKRRASSLMQLCTLLNPLLKLCTQQLLYAWHCVDVGLVVNRQAKSYCMAGKFGGKLNLVV